MMVTLLKKILNLIIKLKLKKKIWNNLWKLKLFNNELFFIEMQNKLTLHRQVPQC